MTFTSTPSALWSSEFMKLSLFKSQIKGTWKSSMSVKSEVRCMKVTSKITFILMKSDCKDAEKQTFSWWIVSHLHYCRSAGRCACGRMWMCTPHAYGVQAHQTGKYTGGVSRRVRLSKSLLIFKQTWIYLPQLLSLLQLLGINELSILYVLWARCPRTRWYSSAGIETPYLSESRRDGCFVLEPCHLWLCDKELRRVPPIWRKKKDDPEVNSDYDKNLSSPSILFILTLFLFILHTSDRENNMLIYVMATCPSFLSYMGSKNASQMCSS